MAGQRLLFAGNKAKGEGPLFFKESAWLAWELPKWLWEQKSPKLQFGSRSSGSLFSKETLQRQFNREIEASSAAPEEEKFCFF